MSTDKHYFTPEEQAFMARRNTALWIALAVLYVIMMGARYMYGFSFDMYVTGLWAVAALIPLGLACGGPDNGRTLWKR